MDMEKLHPPIMRVINQTPKQWAFASAGVAITYLTNEGKYPSIQLEHCTRPIYITATPLTIQYQPHLQATVQYSDGNPFITVERGHRDDVAMKFGIRKWSDMCEPVIIRLCLFNQNNDLSDEQVECYIYLNAVNDLASSTPMAMLQSAAMQPINSDLPALREAVSPREAGQSTSTGRTFANFGSAVVQSYVGARRSVEK